MILNQKAQAQFGQLLNKAHTQRYEEINKLYAYCVGLSDTTKALKVISALKQYGVANGARDLEMESNLLRLYFYTTRKSGQKAFISDMINDLEFQIQKWDYRIFKARFFSITGNYHWKETDYERAFEYFLKVFEIQKNLDFKDFPDKPNNLYRLGECYYFFHDYNRTIFFLGELLRMKPEQIGDYLTKQSINTIDLCYQHLDNLDSSDAYFSQNYEKALRNKDEAWAAISSGNLGYNQFLRGRYKEAIPLLEKDVQASLAREDWGCASGSQMALGSIYLLQNKVSRAAKCALLARQWVLRSGQSDRLKILYPLLSKLYGVQGNTPLSAAYLDSSIYINNQIANKYNALQLLRAQQKNDLLKHRAEIETIRGQQKLMTLERNTLIALLIIAFITSFFVYHLWKKKNESRRMALDAQLSLAKNELALATSKLNDFARNITEKNRLLEEVHQQMKTSDREALWQLQQKTILTDHEWEHFRNLFEQVHGSYLVRPKEKLPGLTRSEIRFMALAKMQFTNKEMAAALGIGPQAVRTIWYRLRKKLNLPEDATLEELVAQI
jgi:DNA-binding CsgD family transcriptional regulator